MVLTIQSIDEIAPHRAAVAESARRAADAIHSLSGDGIDLLRRMKFELLGFHPLESRRLNLIEQVNQTFTYLVSLEAVRILLELHPEAGGFRLNLGVSAGSDVESVDRKLVAAEVFAAVTPRNNRKLTKDIAKVAGSPARHRYVFFYAPGYEAGRQVRLESSACDVQVWAVELQP